MILSNETYEQRSHQDTGTTSFIHALLSAPKAELDISRTSKDCIPAIGIFDDCALNTFKLNP